MRQSIANANMATIAGIDESGRVWVQVGDDSPMLARSVIPVGVDSIGREVAILGDEGRPIILGFLQDPRRGKDQARPVRVEVEGESLVFTADKDIVLRCGKASLTLTRAGKVLLRGAYVLSRSSGVNRIKGGAVRIN